MPDPTDVLRAWEAAIRELGETASSVASGTAELAGQASAPFKRQAELLERIVRQQLEFERELVTRATAPARAILDLTDQSMEAMRAQAAAFRAAALSLAQVADILEQQVGLLQQTTQAVRDPIATIRSAGAGLRGSPPAT